MLDDPKFEGVDCIKSQVESWRDISPSKLKVERLSGLSNEIWKVSSTEDVEPKTVIFRKFGDAGAICDRERENYIIQGLAKKKLSPPFYGGNKEYRIEKFEKSEPLSPEDVKDKLTRRRIARLLADLHSLDFPKLDKTPFFMKILTGHSFIKDFEEKAARDVYSPVEQKFLKEIKELINEEETSFLKSIAPKEKESIAFSHNDLHSQNILVLDKDKTFALIDYEYSGYNYRAYDIANFFCETMFEYDTAEHPHYILDESKFPNERDLKDFIRYYLFFGKYTDDEIDLHAALNDDSYRDNQLKENKNMDEFNKEVDQVYHEVQVCEIFSHYFWCLWAVVKSHDADIEFDYMHFAYKRLELYQKLKKKLNHQHQKGETLGEAAP